MRDSDRGRAGPAPSGAAPTNRFYVAGPGRETHPWLAVHPLSYGLSGEIERDRRLAVRVVLGLAQSPLAHQRRGNPLLA